MADRILRDELWQSERFLGLSTDTARLSFVRFVSLADDFGNFEGGQRRLFRTLQACTQVKTIEASTSIIDELMQVDLLRRYEVDSMEYFHIPRFRSHRQYLSRRYPQSPWCDKDATLGKTIRNKGHSRNVATTSQPRSNDVAEGVGVGVNLPTTHSTSGNRTTRDSWQSTEAGITAMGAKLNIPARPGESYTAWKDRLVAALRNKV